MSKSTDIYHNKHKEQQLRCLWIECLQNFGVKALENGSLPFSNHYPGTPKKSELCVLVDSW